MKSKKPATSQPIPKVFKPEKTQPYSTAPRISRLENMNQSLQKRQTQVIGGLVLLWLVMRVFFFDATANSALSQLYRWQESDSYFFDEWARALAGGDWLNRQPMHPYHGWHQDFANHYFKEHPDKLSQILTAYPNRDSSFVPGKVLWNEWYGGNRYHQEPFYAYLLAVLYALTDNGTYWMMVLQTLAGIASGFLLWLIARRYFNDSVALATGLLYAFCGIILFQETLILRTSWSVLFSLLTVWTFQRALDNQTKSAFLISGAIIGLAFTLQSYFVLFLLGALVIYFLQERTWSKTFARNAGLVLGGFMLTFSPVILRNIAVGAPVFSTNSIGAVTFVSTNVSGTQAISRWQPEAAKCADIMGKTNGAFAPAVIESLKSHSSVGSYLQLMWSKFQSVINGLEWPNNENYYFYKETVPILKLTFLDFYWIAWLGCAGILFSMYHRKKCRTLYLAILLQLLIMLGFYVLGRLRAPLAVLLLPFAAYCIIESFRWTQISRKEVWGKVAVVALCFFFLFYQFQHSRVNLLEQTDFNVLYEIAYFDRVKNNAEARHWSEAIAAHAEFLDYQPDFVKKIKAGQLLKSPSEIKILEYFANHAQIHSYLYEDSGNKGIAAKEMAKYNLMKTVAENSRKRLTK